MLASLAAPLAAQQIIPSGHTATGLAVSGNVTDVTTATRSGQNAFNSFSKFDVYSGNVVNLHLPDGTANLLNVVRDHRSHIDGLLNSIKGGEIGGNVFFANPHGVIVGEAGVINVGALHLSTPTPEFIDRLLTTDGLPDPAATGQLLSGQVPVSADAPITVRGTVNVHNDVSISAGAVNHHGVIQSGAVFAGARVDFADIVNVAGLESGAALAVENGTIRILAAGDIVSDGLVRSEGADGVAGGSIELRAGGDIRLEGDALLSASGRGAGSDGGEVIVIAERDALLVDRATLKASGGDISGDGGFVEFSARRQVTLAGGSLKAEAVDGLGGTVLIDPEDLVIATDLLRDPGGNADGDGVSWSAGSLVLEADNSLTIGEGVVVSSRAVGSALRADHIAGDSTGDSGNLTLLAGQIVLQDDARLLAHGGNGFVGGSVLLAANASGGSLGLADVVASITAGSATITGAEVTLEATATLTTSLVPVVVRDVAATIDLNGTRIEADGQLGIHAGVTVSSTTTGLLPAATVEVDALASVDVRGDSLLRTTGGDAAISAGVSVAAEVEAGLPDLLELPFDAGVAVALVDSTARIRIRDQAELDIAGGLTLSAANSLDISALTDASAQGESSAGGAASVGILDVTTTVDLEDDARISNAAALTVDAATVIDSRISASAATDGADSQGEDQDGNLQSQTEQLLADYGDQAQTADGGIQVAAAVAVSQIVSTTRAWLGASERSTVAGQVAVNSHSATSAVVSADGSAASGGVGVGVGVALNLAEVSNLAGIDQGLDAAGLTVSAGIDPVGDGHLFETMAVSGAGAADVGAAGSFALNVVDVDTAALLGGSATVDAGGGSVLLQADSAVVSSASATPADGGATGETVGIGASVAINVGSASTRAELGNGAALDGADDVSLLASGEYETSSEAEAGSEGGVGLTPVVAVTLADNQTIARLGSGPRLDLGGTLTVEASHAADTQASAEADAAGESVAIGASVAVNVASDLVQATTQRDVAATGGDLAFTAVSAASSGASAKASAKGGKEETDGETPEDGVDQEIGRQLALGQGQQSQDSANQAQQPGSAQTSEGKLSVAAAIAVNVADARAEAWIPDGRYAEASGGLFIAASGNTDAAAAADGSSAGSTATVGIGAAVAVNKVSARTQAWVGAAEIIANGVEITAGMTDIADDAVNTFSAEASSGAGGGKVGIAGALALNLVEVRSTATLRGGAEVDASGGAVLISAGSASSTSATAKPDDDGGAAGGQVGIGASAAVNTFSADQARAAIEQGASLNNAGSLALTADSSSDTTAEAEAGAEGSVAIDAVVAFSEVKQSSEAVIAAGAPLEVAGTVSLSATASGEHTATATGDVESGKVGVGASAAIIISNTLTRAALERDLVAGGGSGDALLLHAGAERSYEAVAFASAAGAKDEDEISPQDKDRAKSTSTLKDTENSQQGTQGGSKVNVAAAAGVLVMDDDIEAVIAPGRTIRAHGDIGLTATGDSNFSARGRGDTLDITKIGNTQVGIGVGVGLAIARNDTTVLVGDGTRIVEAGDITLAATSSQNTGAEFVNKLTAEGVSGAGSSKVSVAGALAVANSNATTEARLGDGVVIEQAGQVSISADNTSKLSAKAWSGALSNKVGVGASVATLVSNNTYRAAIGSGAELTLDGLALSARNHEVSGSVPFDFEFSLDGASVDSFTDKFSEQNLQVLLGENNYYTEALAGAGGGQVAVTGSFAINIFDDTTEAEIGAGSSVTASGAVELEASNETMAKAFAGALAAGKNAGVGLNTADIINSSRTAAVLGDGARILDSSVVTLEAAAAMDFGVFGASLGAASTAGVGGVLALVLADNEVVAETGTASRLVSRGDATLSAVSSYRSLMVAGGAAGGSSAGVGASAATNVVETTVRAELGRDADARVAGTLAVEAGAEETTKTIAVAGGAASSAGVGAGVIVNVIEPTIQALIASGAKVNVDENDPLVRGERVLVLASAETDLLAIAGGVGAAGSTGIGAGVDVGVVSRSIEAAIGAGAEVRASEEIRVSSINEESIFSIGAAAGGGGDVGLSGAAAGHSLTTTTLSSVAGGATLHSFGNVIIEADSATDLSVIAGGAALGGTAGIGISAGVVVLDKQVEASIGDGASVTAWGTGSQPASAATGTYAVGFSPHDPARSSEEIQNPGADQYTDEAANAGGELLTDQRSASRGTDELHGLAVTATSRDDIRAIAAAGGIGGTVAVTFGGAVGVLDSVVSAWIGDGALINADNSGAGDDQSVRVAAGHDFYHLGLGGAASGAGTVGGGAGADVMVINLLTEAGIGSGAILNARRDVDVLASARQDLLSVSGAAGAGGTVGIAGAVGVIVLDSVTRASIGANALVDADGNVRVTASDDTRSILVAGSVGIGLGAVGVGGSVGVNSITKRTEAFIGDGATVNARGGRVPVEEPGVVVPSPDGQEEVEAIEDDPGNEVLDPQAPPEFPDTSDFLVYTGEDFDSTATARGLLVQATSSEDLLAIAAAGSGGLYAGVSGAITVENIRSVTRAWIGDGARINVDNALANADQDVNVTARNSAELLVIDGSLAIGPLGAGVAGSVDVGLIRNDTSAWIGAGAEVNANRDIDVNALARKEIDSYVISAAGGIVGIAAGIGVYSLGEALDADSRGRLTPDGGDESANQIADEQSSDGTLTASLENYDNPRLAAIGQQAGARRSQVSISGSLTAAPPSGTSAFIGDGAVLNAGRHIDLDARDDVSLEMVSGAAAVGAVSLGAGVSVATVNTNVLAFTGDDVVLTAGLEDASGEVSLTARLDSASAAAAYAGSGGLVALDAAAAVFNDSSVISASLGSGAQVSQARALRIEAIDRRSQLAEAFGAGVGAATAGVSVATTVLGGSVSATLGQAGQVGQAGSLGEIIVLADSAGSARAEATSARAGIGQAASGTVSTATVNTGVTTTVGAGSALAASDTMQFSALAAPKAEAESLGVNVAGGAAIGASVATATAAPQVATTIGDGVQFSGGGLSVLAQSQPASGIDSARAHATGASGGVLFGGNATVALARSSGTVNTTIGDGVALPAGSVVIRANHFSRQDAAGLGLAAGIVALGANDVEAISTNTTMLTVGTGLVTQPGRLGDLTIVAEGNDSNRARSVAGSGGVVAGNASFAETRDTSTVTTTVAGGSTLYTGALLIDAAHTDQFAPSADSVNAAAVGASGAFARHRANSTVATSLGAGLEINAAGPVIVSASNTFSDSGSGERASGAAGGVASGAAVGSTTEFTGQTSVTLGDGVSINSGTDPVLNPGGIELVAATFLNADEQVSLVTGGVLAGAATRTRLDAGIANSVTVGTNSELVSQGHLGVGTFAQVLASTTSLVNTYGGAAVGSADSTNVIVSNQSVTIGSGSFLQGAANVDITAGRDPAGFFDTFISATSSAQGYVRGVIAVPKAEAETRITSIANLGIGSGAVIRSGRNTTIGAYQGTPLANADGTGRGFQLGFIPVTERDSTVVVNTAANVVHNGSVTAGIFNELSLQIPDCANDGIFCSTLDVLTTGDVPPYQATYLPGFDPAAFVSENFQGSAAQLLLSGVSSTPVAAWQFGTLFVAGGQVIVNAGNLAGNGSLTARGGPRISITNLSPAYLVMGPALIPNTPGGRVLFTGAAGASQAQGLTINEINSGQTPVVNIENLFNGPVGTTADNLGPALFLTGTVQNLGGLVNIENVSGSLGQIATVFGQQVQLTVPAGVAVISVLDGTWQVSGDPETNWADFMIWPGGNPTQGSPNANQAAAWAANVYAVQNRNGNANTFILNRGLYGFAGDQDNNSYVFYGFCAAFALSQGACTNQTARALSPVGQAYAISGSDFNHRWFPVVPVVPLATSAGSYAQANLSGSEQGAAIFGSQVLIEARFLDINARIIAGQPTDWSVVLPESLTAGPGPLAPFGGAIWLHDQLYAQGAVGPTLDLGNLPRVNPTLDERIRATYDARTGQITLDNVNASSGGARVVLEGQIMSTNPLGQVLVNGGLGTINVQNDTGRELVLQQLNTGNTTLASALENRVQITDTGRPSASNQWLYLYSPADGLRVFNGPQGASLGTGTPVFTSSGSSAVFEPRAGLRWEWQLRSRIERVVTTDNNGWVANISGWRFAEQTGEQDANNPWLYATVSPFSGGFTSQLSPEPTGRLIQAPGGPVFQQQISAIGFEFFRQGVNYHGCGSTTCNFGFRRTGAYTAPAPAGRSVGEGFGSWSYRMARRATLVMTQSVKADNPIGIDFAGNPRGTLNVSSNAPVLLSGELLNPNGDTSFSVTGNLLASASGSLLTDEATLVATGSIGSLSRPFAVTMSGTGVLNAAAGGAGLFLDIDSTARLGSLVAGGPAGGWGDVVVAAAGNLLRAPGLPAGQANVTGRSITLVSTLGSVGDFGTTGYDGTPLLVDARPTLLLNGGLAGGEVSVLAQNDIALRQESGPLLIGSIESTGAGAVFLSAPGGSLLSADGQTAAQALAPEQVLRIWQDLQLTEGFGAPLPGDATAASVLAFEGLIEREYQRYWQLRERGSVQDGVFVLDDEAIRLYRPVTAIVTGIGDPDDAQVRVYTAGLFDEIAGVLADALGQDFEQQPGFAAFDPAFSFQPSTGQVEALTARAVWTESELSAAINSTALQPAAGTPVGVGTPNVIGRTVVLDSGSAIGRLADPVFIGLADLQAGNLDPEQSAALALASTPGDVLQVGVDAAGNQVTWVFGEQPEGTQLTGFSVAQTSPLFVAVTGEFRANTGGEAFIQSAGQVLTLDQLIAAGDVTLTAPQSIISAGTSPVPVTAGGNLTILAGSGNIGSADLPLVFDIGGQLLAASAGQDAFLRALGGDLRVGRVFAGQRAWLDAADGSLLGTLDGVIVEAADFNLFALNDIGSASAPFTVRQQGQGQLDAVAGGTAWLFAPTAGLTIGSIIAGEGIVVGSGFGLTAGTLEAGAGRVSATAGGGAGEFGRVTAGTTIELTALGSLSLEEAEGSGDIDLAAGDGLLTVGPVSSSGGAIEIGAGGSATLGGRLDAGTRVHVLAGAGVTVADEISAPAAIGLEAGGDIALSSGVALLSSDGDIELAAGGALTMGDGSLAETGSGTISLQAVADILLGRLVSGSAADLLILSEQGAIRVPTVADAEPLIQAPGALLRLDAASGIGRGGVLRTEVARLDAQVRAAGDINLANTASLWIEQAETADGAITITADGGLSAQRVVVTGGDGSRNLNISLQALAGDLSVLEVATAGDASLLASGSLLDLGEGDTAVLTADTITLQATTGNIGANGRDFGITSGDGAPVTATAGGAIWLREWAGDLTIGAVSAADDVRLTAAGSLLGAAPGLHVTGERISLASLGGRIGSEALRLVVDSRNQLDALAASGIRLEETSGDLVSAQMITQTGSIDLLVREGSGVFGEVLAPDDVTIVANGSLLSIDLLDPETAFLAATAPGSMLQVALGFIGGSAVFNADQLQFPELIHTGLEEPLRLAVSGHAGGLADSALFSISSLPGVVFDPLRVREAEVSLTGDRLQLVGSQVTGRGLFETSSWSVLVDNVNRRLFPVDVQLYSALLPVFELSIDETSRIRTDALAINYQRYMIVNEFSTENSMTLLVPKMLAIAEDADGSGEADEAEPGEPVDIELAEELLSPSLREIGAATDVRITL